MRLGEVWRLGLRARLGALGLAGAAVIGAGAGPALAASPVAHAAEIGAAPASQQLELVLPLAADEAGLERFARAVTTPGAPQYRQYESIGELAARFGASAATRRTVISYLRRAGARQVSIDATGLFADATVTAGLARRLFETPLARFSAAGGPRFVAPTTAVTVPAPLRGLVTAVVGLDNQPLAMQSEPFDAGRGVARAHAAAQPSSLVGHTGTASGCAAGEQAGEMDGNPETDAFTPNQYLTAYGFDPIRAPGKAGAGERVALIEIDGFKFSDVKTFASCFGLDIPAIQAFGVGIHNVLPPGSESTLDVEVLDAAAPDLSGIDVYETRPQASSTLRALTAPLQNRRHHPQVISVSLGLCEPAVVHAVGIRGIGTIEGTLAMAAASGTTVLASSGDQGSADCTTADGFPLRGLAVNYPASSPWVTGVGGTNITLDAANQLTGQVVWNDAGALPGAAGGGGLSGVFRRPSYQDGTVRPNRRAVPDVAMLGDVIPGFAVFCSAQNACITARNPNPWGSVGGTSAGTPLLAGGFALVDQALAAKRREPLGFVNPLLYNIGRSPAATSVFSDVLSFGNDVGPFIGGSGQPLGCCTAGPGFDFASGWGSVNLANLALAAGLLQPPQLGLSLPGHQRPLASKRILARVSCAGACRIAAYALITIGRAKPREFDSRVFQLAAAGATTIPIPLSPRELGRLRSGLRHRQRIVASVFGLAVDGRNNEQAQTAGKRLTVAG
jgi:kumamolisin